jgi:hypothetical protein
MRKFSSYGPIDTELHYYAPRTALIDNAYQQLIGDPEKGGHYVTIWAPRQTGKTWIMQQVVNRIKQYGMFDVAIITMQSAKEESTTEGVLDLFVTSLREWFQKDLPEVKIWKKLYTVFTKPYFEKPVIVILDEFDALGETVINQFANEFRSMYTRRVNEGDKRSHEKSCLLHGLALIGVRSVLGIENVRGSPFNVQRSVHIPNLTFEEVNGMFAWYTRENGQPIDQEVIKRLYYETNGHPGLTCWFGELLTEGCEEYQVEQEHPITMKAFERVYAAATYALPNNTIVNIISKAKQEPYRTLVLTLFKTDEKLEFSYDDVHINFLYLNGVIDKEVVETAYYIKFACPYVQKRLFNYFAHELFQEIGKLHDPFDNLDDTITTAQLHVKNLLKRYQSYLQVNKDWLFKNAPRRADLRITEAVYHFNLYMYLHKFLRSKGAKVWPEFPTGNGKIDILITYCNRLYGIEVKSFTAVTEYRKDLQQAALYGSQLQLQEITLAFFIEAIDEEYRSKYEVVYLDETTGVTVNPVFIETGT